MDNVKISNRSFERVGWGLLAILWGVVILVDFVPFEVGLIGTGLIMLSVAWANNHLSLKNDGTVIGVLMLAWARIHTPLAPPVVSIGGSGLGDLCCAVDWMGCDLKRGL